MVYCVWDVYLAARKQRERRLRERVCYMLWVMATGIDDSARDRPGVTDLLREEPVAGAQG
jgi:hypothetical protein